MTSAESFYQRFKPYFHWLLVFAGLLLLVVALWLPTGLNVSGWGDEWAQMARMDQSLFSIGTDIRPLIQVSWWFAHLLTPDSFLGMNVLFMLALLGKGIGLYALLILLKADMAVVAFASAALFIVYPSDTTSFALAVLNLNLSAGFFLLAACCLILYWRRPSIMPALGILFGLFVALGIVEVSVPLVAFFPIILIVLERGFRKRLTGAIALWYVVPVIYALRALILTVQGYNVLGYQAGSLGTDNSLSTWVASIFKNYRWQIVDAWPAAPKLTQQTLSNPTVWLSLVVVFLIIVILWAYSTRSMQRGLSRDYLVLIIAGLVVLGLGFLPFVFTSYRDSNSRTTLFSSGGAALVVAVFIVAAAQLSWKVRVPLALIIGAAFIPFYRTQPIPMRYTAILMAVLLVGMLLPRLTWRYALMLASVIGIGFGYSVYQHQTFQEAAQVQEAIFQRLIHIAPEFKPGTSILLLPDEKTSVLKQFLWNNIVFQSALQYLYHDISQKAYLCDNQQENNPYAILAICRFEPDRISVAFNAQRLTLPYDKVVIFRYSADDGLQLVETFDSTAQYAPLQRVITNAPLPQRLTTVFTN